MLGVVSAGFFAHAKSCEDKSKDITFTLGAALELKPWMNAINYFSTVNEPHDLDRYLDGPDPQQLLGTFPQEVEAYCQDFPLHERHAIAQQYWGLLQGYCALESNPKTSLRSPAGRMMAAETHQRQLANRAHILEYCQANPHVLQAVQQHSEQHVEGARAANDRGNRRRRVDQNNGLLVVTGMHRTGSTLLQRILALDPRCRSPVAWEMMDSIPPLKRKEDATDDPRAAKCAAGLDISERFVCPGYLAALSELHRFRMHYVEEDVIFLMHMLVPFQTVFMLSSPSLQQMLLSSDAYHRYLCRLLHVWFQVAMDRGYVPRSHWITKNPDHAQYLEQFLAEFPEANIVITHRHPRRVIPSWYKIMLVSQHTQLTNKYGHTRGSTPASLTPRGLGEACMSQMLSSVTRMMLARDRLREADPQGESKQFFDVCFTELVNDPVGVVERIYEHFGYEITDAFRDAIKEYMAENARGKGDRRFKYELEDIEISEKEVEEHFREYIERYQKFF